MDSVAVDYNVEASVCSRLAHPLQENKYTWRLLVLQARVKAHHDIVQQHIDAGDLLRVKGCLVALASRRYVVALLREELEDEAYLQNLGTVEQQLICSDLL